jgi:phage gp46-like protein
MFDIATRPVPVTTAQAEPGVPFDWRLGMPLPAANFPWVNYSASDGVPVSSVDVLQTFSLALEDTLQTAIGLSLFSDGRAGDGEGIGLPSGDRRGWVGDEFQDGGDSFGGLLWLVLSGKVMDDVLARAKFYATEALGWMVRDGIAANVVVDVAWVNDRLTIRPQIYKADQLAPVYDVLWGTTLRRGASR